ncbi:GNAT family N-acetyltransferase [Legionella israelensis]|uniref:GNAT family N-acetyltransferase n=1 Tax=Legionella israelensis TaxID=454 RepID=UPI00117C2FD9|nr:GNAT family protein [Legionella israelensis]QDP73276.1 GNAT family N-acetyltransferase [Legionella israelensis]
MIETERLLIRKPMLGDAKPLNDAINRSLAELQRWMPWANDPSLATTEKFIEGAMKQWDSDKQTDFPMIVVLKATGQIIGASGYNNQSNKDVPFYEIGYWLDTHYTGQGLATELTAALTHYAFTEYQAARVQIKIQAANERSRNVAERCGFTIEARLHHHCIDCQTGEPADDLIYAMFDLDQLIAR